MEILLLIILLPAIPYIYDVLHEKYIHYKMIPCLDVEDWD